MSSYDTLLVDINANGIAHVTLNRPEKRNALSAQMIAELTDLAKTTGAAPNTRAMTLSGAGDVFCAGGDLAWMQAQINADRPQRMAEARKLADMLRALNEMPTPLIGRIHGGAYGGGVGLACICDVVIAEENTRFAFTETRLGLIPATIAPYAIARLGEARARRVFMSSRPFGADEAQTLGLVAQALPMDLIDTAVAAETAPYLTVAPKAVGRAKALARRLGPVIDDAVIDASIRHLADAWETDEAREGLASFLEKRPPPWTT